MTTTHALVQKFLSMLGAQDPHGIAELFSEKIDWYVPGADELPWTGRRSRRDDIPVYFEQLWSALVPGASSVEVRHLLIEGSEAAVFSDFSHVAAATGRPFATATVMHLSVEGGKLVKLHLYEDTAVVRAAFL